jgi:hypothetical protein
VTVLSCVTATCAVETAVDVAIAVRVAVTCAVRRSVVGATTAVEVTQAVDVAA